MDSLQAQVYAQFGQATGSTGLAIENDPLAQYVELGDVPLLLFPAVDAHIATDVGTVRFGNNKAIDVAGGIVQLSGGNEVSLPRHANASGVELRVLFAFDEDGIPTQVGLQYDPVRNSIRASRNCYAAIAFSPYKTLARELIYRPKFEPGYALLGVVAAFYPVTKGFAIYQVQPFGSDTGNSIFELYRIVSYSVATPDGEFEKPPNFPSSGAYPDDPIPALNPQNATMAQRVHEIAQMDSLGRVFISTYHHPVLEPYVGNDSYKPVKELIASTVPQSRGFSPSLIAKAKNEVAKRGQGKL